MCVDAIVVVAAVVIVSAVVGGGAGVVAVTVGVGCACIGSFTVLSNGSDLYCVVVSFAVPSFVELLIPLKCSPLLLSLEF